MFMIMESVNGLFLLIAFLLRSCLIILHKKIIVKSLVKQIYMMDEARYIRLAGESSFD